MKTRIAKNLLVRARMGVLLCLLLLQSIFLFAPPGSAADLWLDVPVRFIGDRKSIFDNGKYSSIGDQVVGAQNIWFGIAHVPVKLPKGVSISDSKLEELGCKKISMMEAQSPAYWDLNPQLSKSSTAVAMPHAGSETASTPWSSEQLGGWYAELKSAMQKCESKSVPIFVHGCCMSQKMALQDAAQMQLALKVPVIEFDWASVGVLNAPPLPEINSYRRSERALEVSEINFVNFLERTLAEFKADQISLIGHSMGTRLITTALRQTPPSHSFGQLHFVRPDLSFQAFLLDEKRLCSRAKQSYVYCASNDSWLKQSESLSGGVPRLGRPAKLLDLLREEKCTPASAASFVDITSLHLGHAIPYKLLADIMQDGAEPDSVVGDKKILQWKDRIWKVGDMQRETSKSNVVAGRDN